MFLKVKVKNPEYPYRNRYASYVVIPEFNTYVGQVVKPKPRWLSPNQFMLTTGDYEAPVRILDKTDIVAAWVNKSVKNTNVQMVENKYIVTKGPLNRYSCTCTAYKYRNRCSHIDEVKKNDKVSVKRSKKGS